MVICSIRENVTRFFAFLLVRVVRDVTSKPMLPRESSSRRRSCVETLRASSLLLITPLLGFPHRCTFEGVVVACEFAKDGLRFAFPGFAGGTLPHTTYYKRQGTERRATNAVRRNWQTLFSARTPGYVKPDGLTPVALWAKRPLIAPSRPSSSRLGRFEKSLWRRKVGRGSTTCERGWGSAPHIQSSNSANQPISGVLRRSTPVFAVPIFPGHYCVGAWWFGFVGGGRPIPDIIRDKARNGGRRSRSAAKPQSDRWSPKRFAPPRASSRSYPFSPNRGLLPAKGGSRPSLEPL